MEKMQTQVIKHKGKRIYKDDRCTYQLVNGMRLAIDEKKLNKELN